MCPSRNRKRSRARSRPAEGAAGAASLPASRPCGKWTGAKTIATFRPQGANTKPNTASNPGKRRREMSDNGQRKGFFTDTTICIGCKACEVACKQWNQLPDDGFHFTGMSYDNTVSLGASTWRHVAFIERPVALSTQDAGAFSWLFSSDVCKHCARAGCLESCPTGAIVRTEFGSVYVQPDVCNGCGYCIVNCPFGVIDRRQDDGRAWKCTLCYDRLKEDMAPACAKACPTESIKFGDLDHLRDVARERVERL